MTGVAYLLGDIVIYYCCAVAVLFIIGYSAVKHWWKTEFGPHLFSFMFVIALAFVYIVVTKIFGRFDGWEFFRLALLVLLAFVLTWRTWILVKVQWAKRRTGK